MDLLNYLLERQQATDERVLVATFDYDLLIDTTAKIVVTGWALNSLDSYIERPDFRLFKLHGSTGWSRYLADPSWARYSPLDSRRLLIDKAMDLEASPEKSSHGLLTQRSHRTVRSKSLPWRSRWLARQRSSAPLLTYAS